MEELIKTVAIIVAIKNPLFIGLIAVWLIGGFS